MNAEIITREVHNLLQEIATYEEPRILLDEVPSLSTIAKNVFSREPIKTQTTPPIKPEFVIQTVRRDSRSGG